MNDLPVPPERLRMWVGPFSDAELFCRSGEQHAAEIAHFCHLSSHARVLDVGCGCGRIARALPGILGANGHYEGIDVARPLIAWCKEHLEPQLPNFRFSFVDVRDRDRNPEGTVCGSSFEFPFDSHVFDVAIGVSLFTHMLPEEVSNYVAQLSRVLRPEGRCFLSLFLFDADAKAAVARGSTIFDFRHGRPMSHIQSSRTG